MKFYQLVERHTDRDCWNWTVLTAQLGQPHYLVKMSTMSKKV